MNDLEEKEFYANLNGDFYIILDDKEVYGYVIAFDGVAVMRVIDDECDEKYRDSYFLIPTITIKECSKWKNLKIVYEYLYDDYPQKGAKASFREALMFPYYEGDDMPQYSKISLEKALKIIKEHIMPLDDVDTKKKMDVFYSFFLE